MLQRRTLLASLTTAALVPVAACTGEQPDPPPSPDPTPTPPPSPEPTPTPDTNPLTGGELSDNGVFAVKIDNLEPARPQVGIRQADIIVVEQVEAQMTRLAGVFHSQLPKAVGPVRSARNTDVELLPVLGKPGLVYSGANSKVQAKIKSSPLVPIEVNDRDPNRPAPHNVVADLAALSKEHKAGKAGPIGWTFAAEDERWDAAEKSAKITTKIGADTFTFTPDGDQYRIAVNDDDYVDADGDEDVLADNVVVLAVKDRPDTDSTSNESIVSETVGEGKVEVSREGRTLSGTWQRKDATSPMLLTDGDGEPIALRPGRTWLLLQGS